MHELSSIHGKGFLVSLIGNTISDSGTEHHLVAAHEVEHDILEGWLESLWVNQIEVHLIVSGNLDPFVSFNEVDEASHIDLVVLLPLLGYILVLVFFLDDLEKHNFTRGSCNECFVVEKIHLTEVHVSHLLELDGLSIISINGESLALSVERVDNVLIRVVETLVREIL